MIIPLIYSGLPASVIKNSKVLYQSKAQLELEHRHFSEEKTKIQSYKLDYNNVVRSGDTETSWAAIGHSISIYYNKKTSIRRITSGVKKTDDFRNEQSSGNTTISLRNALKLISNHSELMHKQLSPSHIKKEIQNNRPVCVRFQPEGSASGRFVVIYGFTQNDDKLTLHIADPWDGYHDVDYEYMPLHFKANWTSTYLTA